MIESKLMKDLQLDYWAHGFGGEILLARPKSIQKGAGPAWFRSSCKSSRFIVHGLKSTVHYVFGIHALLIVNGVKSFDDDRFFLPEKKRRTAPSLEPKDLKA